MNTQTPPLTSTDARERLLAAALDQFTLQGYAATSVRELCHAAGVTKPVLYYYFKSKEGLYLQLMEESYAQFETILTELASFSGSARERIFHFCSGLFNSYIQQLPLVRLCYSIYYGTPQGAPPFNLDQYYNRLLDVLTELVKDGITTGEIRSGIANDMVWTIMACLNVAIEEQLCHKNPRIDGTSMLRMLDLVFGGIAADKTSHRDKLPTKTGSLK
jgi:AcrR family transcriptional regulator